MKHRTLLGGLSVLVSGLLSGAAYADPGDLYLGKIICHLEFEGAACAPEKPGYDCNDGVGLPTSASVNGDLDQAYTLYIVAVDIDRAFGLREAAFAVEYPEAVNISDWTVCGATFTGENEWPASGGGVRVRLNECGGTEPDPTDPEGDGSVVLGSFQATAYAKSLFEIKPRKFASGDVSLTDCAGGVTDILSTGYEQYMVNLGFAVFGDQSTFYQYPCQARGVVDCGCNFSLSVTHVCCCFEDHIEDHWCTTDRMCIYDGGKAIQTPCTKRCDVACQEIATRSATWGRIKSRHD